MHYIIINTLWIYSTVCYSLITYFIPFLYENIYLSSTRLNHLIFNVFGLRIFLYGDEFNPNEISTIISNHKTIYDIAIMFFIQSHYNKVIMFCLKKSITYIPGIGWWCNRMQFPSLNRNIKDLQKLESVKPIYPIIIYPEGTRYTEQKYNESYKFAKQNDYPISKYAQLPKYKGAFALSKEIVYHMTLIYLDKHNRIITGEIKEFPSSVYIHVKKHTNVPRDETEYKKWIQNEFASIDIIYDNFNPQDNIEMTPNLQNLDYILYTFFVGFHMVFGYWLLC